MFRNKRIKTFTNKMHRIYNRKFSYIEGVLNSCTTLDQIDYAARWAAVVMEQYHQHEKSRISKLYNPLTYHDLNKEISKYFKLKLDIIGLIFERKVKELEKEECLWPADTED